MTGGALPPKLAAIASAFGDDPDAPSFETPILAEGPIWLWRAKDPNVPAAWHFLTIEGTAADTLRQMIPGGRRGFGSVKVEAKLGSVIWNTSLFPDKETGLYFLPMKADVRRRAGVATGDKVSVSLTIVSAETQRIR